MKLSVLKNEALILDYEVDDSKDVELTEIFIGRSDDCHIVLDDHLVSRHHAVISWEGKKWGIKKLSDFGQLLVNGQNIDYKQLVNGDSFVIHGFTINVSDIQVQEKQEEVAPVEEQKNTESDQEGETQELQEEAPEEDLEKASEAIDEVENDDEEGEGFDAGIEEGTEHTSFSSDSSDEAESEGDSFQSDEEGFNEGFDDGGMEGDDGFDGGFDEGGDSGEGTVVLSGFAQFILHIEGDNAPYDAYTLEDKETFIGRDPEKCQIVLDDPEVSTQHAVLKKSLVNVVLEDLGSSNGTILNESRINKSELSNGDIFKIGSTVFRLEVQSELISQEEEYLMPVDENQEITREEVVEEEVDFDELGDEEGLDLEGGESQEEESQSLFKNPKKRKKLIYGAVGLMLVLLLSDDGSDKKKKGKSAKKTEKTSENRIGAQKKDGETKEGEAAENAAKPEEKKEYTPEQLQFLDSTYLVAKSLIQQGNYSESIVELDKIREVDPNYKNTNNLYLTAKEGMKKLEELEKARIAEEERKRRQKKINELVEKAKEAVKKKEVQLSQNYFSQILEIDPENIDVPQLKLEIEAFVKEQERIALEKAQKEAERKRQVGLLQPGKTFYLKKEWYKAVIKLEEFLQNKDMDEDLVREGSDMLSKAKENLSQQVSPLVGKARSFKEGQDLKRAYETYSEILDINPAHEESLNQMISIKETLEMRSRKIYREAIISESLSLFEDAKEKFQEVQQISPTDSPYYQKATERLKRYYE
jgi:pSer/pThr/pTyr-binding forkhead associated (FHA) protein